MTEMSDLEITRKCAKLMGYADKSVGDSVGGIMVCGERFHFIWNPLEDDAQAFALARRFMLDVDFFAGSVSTPPSADEHVTTYCDESINRAICECVAKMK